MEPISVHGSRNPHHAPFLFLLLILLFTGSAEIPAQDVKSLKKQHDENPKTFLKELKERDLSVRKKLVPQLLETYLSDQWSLGIQAGRILEEIGNEAPEAVIPTLVSRLRDARNNNQRPHRLRLLRLFARIGSGAGESVPVLIQELNSGERSIQQAALNALEEIGPAASDALPHIKPLVRASSPLLRRSAFAALTSCGNGQILINALGPALLSGDPSIKRSALKTLEASDARVTALITPLFSLIKHTNQPDQIRIRAARILSRAGPDASQLVDGIMKLGPNTPPPLRHQLQKTLDQIKANNQPPEAKPLEVTCKEGETTRITFPANDPDDLPVGLRVEIVEKPEHGTLVRMNKRVFTYKSKPGFDGKESFRWRMNDGDKHSEPASGTVHLTPDTTPPIVRSVRSIDSNRKRIRIHFEEPIKPDTAKNLDSYALSPEHPIKKATLLQGGHTVRLHVDPLKKDQPYKLTVRNLSDRSAAGNRMPDPVTLSFSPRPPNGQNLLLLARGNGNAKDRSGRDQHGKIKPGASIGNRIGKDGAFTFAGQKGNKKNAINFGEVKPLQKANAFTVAFWFRRSRNLPGNSNHRTSNIMFSQGTDSGNDNIEIGSQGPNLEVFLDTRSGGGLETWNGHIRNHRWYHVALTYNRERDREAWLYLNGTPVQKWSSWDDGLDSAGSPVTIGNTFHRETPFAGWMDDVHVYGRDLKTKEIQYLKGERPYRRGKAPYPLERILLLAPGDGSPKDRSGYRRHGQLTEGVTASETAGKNGAFSFDGSDKKGKNTATFGPVHTLSGARNATVGFWFRHHPKDGNKKKQKNASLPLFHVGNGKEQLIDLGLTDAGVQLFLHTESGASTKSWEGPLPSGRWHHITLTYSADREQEARLYLNGRVVTKWSAWDGPLLRPDTPCSVMLGRSPRADTAFSGWIDELLIYRRPLQKNELQRIRGHLPHSRKQLLLLARGDGHAKDLSGHNRHGTLHDGSSTTRETGIRGAFVFEGKEGNKNNAVRFGSINELQAAKRFTIAFWFRRKTNRDGNSNHGTSNIMFSQGSDNGNDNIEIGTEGNKVEVYLDTEGNDHMNAWKGTIKDNTWYHLALTYDSDREQEAWLFLNGKTVKKWSNWENGLDSAGSPVTLGNTFHIETPFAGRIDEVYVYGRPLENDELLTIMERQE